MDGTLYRNAGVALADAFPKEDIALRNNLGGVSAASGMSEHGGPGAATPRCIYGGIRFGKKEIRNEERMKGCS
jgi:hypothetical protein